MYNFVYDNILLGGTYSAIGFCCGSKSKNLIISKNIYLEDYSPAFRYGKTSYNTQAGKELLEKMEKNQCIVNVAQASIEVYKLAEKNRWKILYNTFVSDIKRVSDGWRVKVHNWDGTNYITCKNVINTQPKKNVTAKNLNVLGESDIPEGDYGAYVISSAFYDGQKVLKLKLDVNDTMDIARLHLLALMDRRELKNFKVILTATEFDYIVSGWGQYEIPSCNFENLVECFEKGYEMGAAL